MGSFYGGQVNEVLCGKFEEGVHFPSFPTDWFIYFWKSTHEELSRYFYVEDDETPTSRDLEPVLQDLFPSPY